jgi:hypothetical protein
MYENTWYWIGYKVCFVFVFIGCWIYCIASYGFLLGVGLGWLPSGIVAAVVSFLWPLVLAALVLLVCVAIYLLLR